MEAKVFWREQVEQQTAVPQARPDKWETNQVGRAP